MQRHPHGGRRSGSYVRPEEVINESIRAPSPLSLGITHPGSGILEFAAFGVAIHHEHGDSALAGPGERHLAREQAGLVAIRPTPPDASLLSGLGYDRLQRGWQCGRVPNLVCRLLLVKKKAILILPLPENILLMSSLI